MIIGGGLFQRATPMGRTHQFSVGNSLVSVGALI